MIKERKFTIFIKKKKQIIFKRKIAVDYLFLINLTTL